MDHNQKVSAPDPTHTDPLRHTELCWKELLDTAFAGWTPTDQALEQVIDRLERRS
ncbi:MAG: hypothetical protein AAGA06_03880 [Pseudomonadota bacterium]